MNTMNRWLVVVSTAYCVATSAALAWNDRGHMLIAMIAYQELKPEVREKVNAILKAHPQRDLLTAGGPAEGPDLDMWVFAKTAAWPDMIRSKNNPLSAAEHHSQWHYINHPINRDSAQGPEPVEKWDGRNDPANIVQAQAKCRAELATAETAPERKAMDLCWVEHLVGDIHQPLHAVALFSKQFPQGDRGGNSFAVKRGESPMNLHSFWDNALGTGTSRTRLRNRSTASKPTPNSPGKPSRAPSHRPSSRFGPRTRRKWPGRTCTSTARSKVPFTLAVTTPRTRPHCRPTTRPTPRGPRRDRWCSPGIAWRTC